MMKFTLFLMLEATPAWLRLPRAERNAIVNPVLSGALDGMAATLRHFDAEAFHARISDVAMIEAASAETAYFVMERLRDSPLIADEYFRLAGIVPAFENGYREFETRERSDAA